ncbi:MAG TPA: adenosylmethionine--8-amino-7-oxononanoate transaminase [Candidatus Desulfofervidus auxilii]|uniref:Adenosylmethionine-8-amino-7-oxononanoate aminotransferase n=1 Tax=Desulfofervidus auxilii TaxID=1621989 RepID=A0A7V0NEM4_DESA2|nr:adenosylmethionine--8-amino-7-oxononanoate transaminase [Candidatus Desulfofervidus auxilii]
MKLNKKEIEHLRYIDTHVLWHPFTQMKEYETENAPIIIAGEGNYLIDIEGNRYLDGVASLWVNIHGHRVKEIDLAIKSQLDKIAHSTLLGIGNVPSIQLAEKLIKITPPGLTKVFYSDNGSTGVEIALKMAFQYWQNIGRSEKKRFLSFHNAYHGDTLGAVGVGGISLFHQIYGDIVVSSIKVPSAYCYRCPWNQKPESCDKECFKAVEETIKTHAKELCAVIIEPIIQAAAGMIVWPKGYLKHLRKLCDEYEVLLICDEVATGFGRTGKMFACEHEKITPDFMVLSKGITGGYMPLAATLTTDKIYKAFYADYKELKTFFHGHSYTGNPLACSAALVNLELFEKNKVIEKLQSKIEELKKLLEKFWELPHVGDIRQAGFMVGIELVKDKKTKEPFPLEWRIGRKVILLARKKGVIIRPLGDVIVILPPLSITKEELRFLCDVIYECIKEVTNGV